MNTKKTLVIQLREIENSRSIDSLVIELLAQSPQNYREVLTKKGLNFCLVHSPQNKKVTIFAEFEGVRYWDFVLQKKFRRNPNIIIVIPKVLNNNSKRNKNED